MIVCLFNNNIRCIEILLATAKKLQIGFNNNIRCIEIGDYIGILGDIYAFNNNIRCIEISVVAFHNSLAFLFNNNIRCIEILLDIVLYKILRV